MIMQRVMQMHKYVMAVTYLFQEIYHLKTTRGREWLPHLIITQRVWLTTR